MWTNPPPLVKYHGPVDSLAIQPNREGLKALFLPRHSQRKRKMQELHNANKNVWTFLGAQVL